MTQNKCGILLVNIGTPDAPTPKAVRRYLREFLSDSRVVEIPRLLWWPILYGVILTTRSRQSAQLYQKIWTEQGSPLFVFSQKIAEKLAERLQIPVELGMHYGKPSIQSALEKLRDTKVDTIFVLPLYPQYSATTTAAAFDQVAATLKTWRTLPSLHFVNQYADNTKYIESLVESVRSFWETQGRAPHLLFSFHGIPQHHVDAGDPYPQLCQLTAKLVSEKLNLKKNEWSMSFQSRLGRAKWLLPYTDKVLQEMPRHGVTHLQVICPGFAVDCLETLEEIGMRGKKQFLHAGGKVFQYIPCLNDQESHINMLADLFSSE